MRRGRSVKIVYGLEDRIGCGCRALIAAKFKGKKVEISRFKGLGEMSAKQLRETTMDPATRVLEQVEIDPETGAPAGQLVDELMGRRPELRLAFIQANAQLAGELDV